MNKTSAIAKEDDLSLFRIALLRHHLQELKDFLAATNQARQDLHNRHKQEMTLITALKNPFGWIMALNRYTGQLTEITAIDKFKRSQIQIRQKQERSELQRWIEQRGQIKIDVLQNNVLAINSRCDYMAGRSVANSGSIIIRH